MRARTAPFFLAPCSRHLPLDLFSERLMDERNNMAVYYSFGNDLVGQEELRTKAALGNLTPFMESLVRRDPGASLQFTTGKATAESVLEGPIIGFKEIGIGKPLTIQIRHVYTGNRSSGFWGNKDMLVA